jgi:hypothetical protein
MVGASGSEAEGGLDAAAEEYAARDSAVEGGGETARRVEVDDEESAAAWCWRAVLVKRRAAAEEVEMGTRPTRRRIAARHVLQIIVYSLYRAVWAGWESATD